MNPERPYLQLLDRLEGILSRSRGWRREVLGVLSQSVPAYPFWMIQVGEGDIPVCLAAGIHGDEVAGVEALVRFLEGLLRAPEGTPQARWRKRFSFRIFPCNNPWGYDHGTRANAQGVDLNRRFGGPDPAPENQWIHRCLMPSTPLHYVDLHEDCDGEGFYLYEICRPRKGCRPVGEMLIGKMRQSWPIDTREEIEGHPNCGGVICPRRLPGINAFRGEGFPLPVYLALHGTPHCLTLETPTRLPLEDRVTMHQEALRILLEHWEEMASTGKA